MERKADKWTDKQEQGQTNRMADKYIARQANKQKYYQRNKNGERQTKKANINMESRQTKI